ncbi:MAG: glycosyltransferase family 2 protein [Planctomycetota bacterium]
MIPISGCVISLDEEDRIEACLRSLAFCDELLVLDSGSSDRTRELAEACGARVEVQPFLGHRAQKQRAVELARHDWVFSLDCDERVTDGLRGEIEARRRAFSEDAAGFSMPRRNVYLGRPMRHGLFWPDRKLRWFDRRRCRWGGTDPHDRVEAEPGARIVALGGEILHDSYRSFAEHRRTVERFAAIAARALRDEGRRAGPLAPWTRAVAALAKGLGPKLAWLDGWRGVLAAWMSARYDYLKYRDLRRLLAEADEGRGR